MRQDRPEYLERKRFYNSLLTIYGRKPVLETLSMENIPCHRLHLAASNRTDGIIGDIIRVAERRGIDIVYHERHALSRISKNSKQDQGVAADIACPNHQQLAEFLQRPYQRPLSLIALDGVTNPQNLGMIIRSVAASPCHGLILPKKGNADISPLVIKASAGTVFKCTLLHCDSLRHGIDLLQSAGIKICVLCTDAEQQLRDIPAGESWAYILGNESAGIADTTRALADLAVGIPMANGVESLNVAVTAALLAFRGVL